MKAKIYRIGEAATLLNLKPYVLRFWETEFKQLIPIRTRKGQRMYSEQNVLLLRTIRHLLYERGLTIEGARKVLGQYEDIYGSITGPDQPGPEIEAFCAGSGENTLHRKEDSAAIDVEEIITELTSLRDMLITGRR
ncbi:MerR family transcriptional regulator [Halodesulfovibrio sp.]|jgi:DNA-binding transcriptional MerR regulator|uniref:MerR family transcriptional regulator n=1 Tax=Halodesulfovibrio sp. TaxID=1912772 RepID=UPI0025F3191F|nr:MerR family transcriptional regulator [Halodesulfovibrio sp.]MCT4534574.1 MerR family transcriptional regulator [Halodesulfovibrio sp.]MCT4626072.1 MerR family transcriptional regulator [Halodesulfovibrio sp.]